VRKIKFRIWDKYFKFMDYDFSNDYLITNDGKVLEKIEKRFANQCWHEYEEDKNCVLMQYTGLKDKNGNKIYEGDILLDNVGLGEVKWVQEHSAFLCLAEQRYYYLESSDGETLKNSETIGNIYENPELI
jgi:hypothetical protein